ncbi:FAD-dependent oxidoreductase [Aliiroseovarius sp. KMU-50]|uniref:FAD-dependent oxidoreductase n=1 Tax=Aliiroseovarius salicola TaxID=3009082 RepID=A0ABT4VY20_9RHOB|nr:FAD-dependent oxidoreductase [Aliiroseovarius sp. KMU-50]MDA5093149.1 FAD-dependent oxidoreductase [Aliiroseovarius sp. KMU-50]
MTQPNTHDVLVIGAGIVGISTALALQSQGRRVTVWDRKGVAQEASKGNAGAFAFAEVEPLAAPGIMMKAPKWLLDPLGPLSVPPRYALKIAPWMLRFWRASWRDRYDAAVQAQVNLMNHCEAAFERQLAQDGDPSHIRREGQLSVYQGDTQFRSALPALKRRQDLGIEVTLLEGAGAIAEIQPGLSADFTRGAFTPGWFNANDPALWAEHLAHRFVEKGGVVEIKSVSNLKNRDAYIELEGDFGATSASHVVICAGAWSHHLSAALGDKLPLETERGYNTTLPTQSVDLRTHVTFGAHGFVMSKIGDGIRVGGAVELGGLDLPPNYKRSEILLKKAKAFFPDLETNNGTQWMGFRPSMPDSLPVIGSSPKARRVTYAFGHGHLGLTQSAGTAELVASLVQGEAPAIDLSPYRPSRF